MTIENLAEAFVKRAGVVDPFLEDCKQIEEAFRIRNFQKAKKKLFDFMMRLAEDSDDIPDDDVTENPLIEKISPEGIPAVMFWGEKVGELYKVSPALAFQLAFDCQNAIEDHFLFCEDIQVGVYSAVIVTSFKYVQLDPRHRDEVCGAIKNVMIRVSEFQYSPATELLFDEAANIFMQVMTLYSPSEQFNHVEELSIWLNSRQGEWPLLQGFVDEIMNLARTYENGIRYIPEIDDGGTPQPPPRPTHLTLVHNSPV